MEIRRCTTPGCECPIPPYREHCEACYIPTPAERIATTYWPANTESISREAAEHHVAWIQSQPVTLDFTGARCGLAQLSHIAVLLETHGTVLIKNCAIQDTPGSMLLEQGMQLEQARATRKALADRPDYPSGGAFDPRRTTLPMGVGSWPEKCKSCGKGIGGVCGACHCSSVRPTKDFDPEDYAQ